MSTEQLPDGLQLADILNMFSVSNGELTWKVKKAVRVKIGDKAGSKKGGGYVQVSINNKRYGVHRIVWAIYNKAWPTAEIDHINGIKDDNRIENLRHVTHTVNMHNLKKARSDNKLGVIGVYLCNQTNKFRSQITTDGKKRNLGLFDSKEDAAEAYLIAKRESHHGCTI